MFAKDVVGCLGHGSVEAVDQGVYFGVLIVKDEEWSKIIDKGCGNILGLKDRHSKTGQNDHRESLELLKQAVRHRGLWQTTGEVKGDRVGRSQSEV